MTERDAALSPETIVERVQAELKPQLITGPTGGRPGNPDWDIARALPMNEATWQALQGIAIEASTPERRVSAMQVAGYIVEQFFVDTDTQA